MYLTQLALRLLSKHSRNDSFKTMEGEKMKFTSLILTLFISIVALADNEPKLVEVRVDKGFFAKGFDDNDNLQITVAGVFPSSCYKLGPAKAEVDVHRGAIRVTQSAYFYGGICVPVSVPFSETISLGMVKAGAYTVVDTVSGKTLGEVPVLRSTKPESDDFLYAPVTDASVIEVNKRPTLVLTGTFTDRCTKLKEVRIDYQKETVVVLPIAEHVNARGECGAQLKRFQHTEPLNVGLTGTFLLHVRAMNGKAINKVVELLDIGDPARNE